MTSVDIQNIVSDAEAARQEISKIDREQPIQNKSNRTWNICFGLLCFGLGIILLACLGWLWCYDNTMSDTPITLYMGLLILVFAICAFVYYLVSKPIQNPEDCYSLNAQYYLMTKNHRVLKCELDRQHNGQYIIHLTMENDKHIVINECIVNTMVPRIVRTDITIPTLNLMDGQLCVPYEP